MVLVKPNMQAEILVYIWLFLVGVYLLVMLGRHKKRHTFLPRFIVQGILFALVYIIGTVVLVSRFPGEFDIHTSFQVIFGILISGVSVKIIFIFPDDDTTIQQAFHWKLLNAIIGVVAGLAAIHFTVYLLYDVHLHVISIIHDFIPVIFMVWNILLLKQRVQNSEMGHNPSPESKVYKTYKYLMFLSITGAIFSAIIVTGTILGSANNFILFIRTNGMMLVLSSYYFILTQHDYVKDFLAQRLALLVGLLLFFSMATMFFILFALIPPPAMSAATFAILLFAEIAISFLVVFGLPFLLKTFFPDMEISQPVAPITLTPRQQEVLTLVGKGLTNREIANALAITEATAKFHVSNLLVEFNCSTRYELARYAE